TPLPRRPQALDHENQGQEILLQWRILPLATLLIQLSSGLSFSSSSEISISWPFLSRILAIAVFYSATASSVFSIMLLMLRPHQTSINTTSFCPSVFCMVTRRRLPSKPESMTTP